MLGRAIAAIICFIATFPLTLLYILTEVLEWKKKKKQICRWLHAHDADLKSASQLARKIVETEYAQYAGTNFTVTSESLLKKDGED